MHCSRDRDAGRLKSGAFASNWGGERLEETRQGHRRRRYPSAAAICRTEEHEPGCLLR